jgi:hypothetical protein
VERTRPLVFPKIWQEQFVFIQSEVSVRKSLVLTTAESVAIAFLSINLFNKYLLNTYNVLGMRASPTGKRCYPSSQNLLAQLFVVMAELILIDTCVWHNDLAWKTHQCPGPGRTQGFISISPICQQEALQKAWVVWCGRFGSQTTLAQIQFNPISLHLDKSPDFAKLVSLAEKWGWWLQLPNKSSLKYGGFPYLRGIHFRTPRGYLELWIVSNPTYTMFFPMCSYL